MSVLVFVMVSAVGQDVIVNEALAAGAGAYLVKPFSEERVLDVVKQLIQ